MQRTEKETRQELQRRLVKALDAQLDNSALSDSFKTGVRQVAYAMTENAMRMGEQRAREEA